MMAAEQEISHRDTEAQRIKKIEDYRFEITTFFIC
jgi:hypothetical protein